MARVCHTFQCLMPGYEALEIAIDPRLTQAQLDHMRRAGRPATAIVDFPNCEIAAPIVGLVRSDPETGDPTDEPVCKPAFPLAWDAFTEWPSDLVHYMIGNQCLADGLADYLKSVHPNLRAG